MFSNKGAGLLPEPSRWAIALNNLPGLYRDQDKFPEAERFYKRSLKIAENTLGPEHPHVATVWENMAELYRQIGKEDEAKRLEARARRIRSNQ
jgi:tetratricopeptide (TPR) repeat protein